METISLATPKSKRGRKPKPFICAWDNNRSIDGLYHCPDGRWRIVASGERFTEPDPRMAVARFERLQQQGQKTQLIAMPVATVAAAGQIGPAVRQASRNEIFVTVSPNRSAPITVSRGIPEAEYIATVRQDLLDPQRREWLARMTGVAQLAWLEDIAKPTASPKLADVVEHYATKAGLSHDESVRARKQWNEFRKVTGAETLKDITHDAVARYETKMAGEGLSPKSIKHRYTKIKTIVAHAMKRGMDSKECRAALDVLAMLEVPDATPLAPHPIGVKDFWTIHAKAVEEKDEAFAAMLLTAANCCMYSGEVAALKWSEINLKTGEVVTARPKTGVARCAMLWPETIVALKALPRERDFVFFSERRSYTTNLISRHFADYRDKAELSDTIKFGDIRDAAYTYACRTVSLDKAKILAGHRLSGATDHYVQRNPGFVKDACEAIRKEFYPVKAAKVKTAAA